MLTFKQILTFHTESDYLKIILFYYLRFTAENPRGFLRNETIAKHVGNNMKNRKL
jgi:hypothetical protein